MRPNTSSVLPSHNTDSQFKDKPISGNNYDSPLLSPGALFCRLTLRRVILLSGSLLFVYIVLSTAFGSMNYNDMDKSEYPFTKHRESDHYVNIPSRPLPSQHNPHLRYGDNLSPHDQMQHQQKPADSKIKPWKIETPPKQQEPNSGTRQEEEQDGEDIEMSSKPVVVDDETNVNTQGSETIVETEEDIAVLNAANVRKASPMRYAQMLDATRRERDYAIALLVREATLALRSTEVYSVTNKNQTAPSNDIHDYLSLSKYFWPNKNKANGLPYKRIDGHVNPEIETVRDYRLLRTMIREVHVMGMAYHFTGRKEYADKCVMRLKEWFLDEATYMNPNINYGSLRKGEKLGARTGVLDMFTIFRVFDALHYLKQEPTWPQDLIPRLQEWFTRYVDWLETSPLAKLEQQGNNNHGTYFDVQIIAIYLFLGRVEDAKEVAQSALHTRIDLQISPKGEQPEEMERKTSWYYSVFNLQALMTLARWGDDLGVDMWYYEGPQGQSIKKAVDFMLPYAISEGEGWPVENLKGFDMTDYLKCLQIAWYIYGDEKYLRAIEVLELKVQKDMDEGKIKTVSTFMCDMSTLLEATKRGGQGFIWHWCLT